MEDEDFANNLGIDRRTLIKRGAVVGGTLVWATPVVQSLSAPAFASGSPACTVTTRFYNSNSNTCRTVVFDADADCCEALNEGQGANSEACRDRRIVSDTTTPGRCPNPA